MPKRRTRTEPPLLLAAVEPQRGNLLRQEPEEEEQRPEQPEELDPVGQDRRLLPLGDVDGHAGGEGEEGRRQEDPERGEGRGHAEDDEEEAAPVLEEVDLGAPRPGPGGDGDEADRPPRAQQREGEGARVGEGVGEHVEELPRRLAPHDPEARGEIGDAHPGDVGGEAGVDPVGQGTVDAGLPRDPRAHDHGPLLPQGLHEPGEVGGVVLAVGVHEGDEVPPGGPDAGLHGGPVAHGVGVAEDAGPGLPRQLPGPVGGAVVHDDDLVGDPRLPEGVPDPGDDGGQRPGFVPGGDHDGDRRGRPRRGPPHRFMTFRMSTASPRALPGLSQAQKVWGAVRGPPPCFPGQEMELVRHLPDVAVVPLGPDGDRGGDAGAAVGGVADDGRVDALVLRGVVRGLHDVAGLVDEEAAVAGVAVGDGLGVGAPGRLGEVDGDVGGDRDGSGRAGLVRPGGRGGAVGQEDHERVAGLRDEAVGVHVGQRRGQDGGVDRGALDGEVGQRGVARGEALADRDGAGHLEEAAVLPDAVVVAVDLAGSLDLGLAGGQVAERGEGRRLVGRQLGREEVRDGDGGDDGDDGDDDHQLDESETGLVLAHGNSPDGKMFQPGGGDGNPDSHGGGTAEHRRSHDARATEVGHLLQGAHPSAARLHPMKETRMVRASYLKNTSQ